MNRLFSIRSLAVFLLVAGVAVSTGLGCGDGESLENAGDSDAGYSKDSSSGQNENPPEYTGADEVVLEAASRYRTGADLHRKVVVRTCGPNDGVCHNRKEYPDLRTPASFVATINAPCNVQPGDYTAVDDRCEPRGDRFKYADRDFAGIEVAYTEFFEGELDESKPLQPDSPGLHIHLRTAIPLEQEHIYGSGQFTRSFLSREGVEEDIIFASFTAHWKIYKGGKHVLAMIPDWQREDVAALLAVGVAEGDQNRNGTFGASQGQSTPLINPGKPEESYLVGRLRGTMAGGDVPGTRMPLANQPLSVSEMLALFCFIEGLAPDGSAPDMDAAIHYQDCSYAEDPTSLNLLGAGVTWKERISKIIDANCASCHGASSPPEGLDLRGEEAFENLFVASKQKPHLKLIEPGRPEDSYMWLKMIGDDSIGGFAMPYDPETGKGALGENELNDIKTWILNGAVRD